MRSSRPVVRALLMTTAVAWSIGVRIPEAEAGRQTSVPQWAGTGDRARRLPGPPVLPFRREGISTGTPSGTSAGAGGDAE